MNEQLCQAREIVPLVMFSKSFISDHNIISVSSLEDEY